MTGARWRPLRGALAVLATLVAASTGLAEPAGAAATQVTGAAPQLVLLYQPVAVGPTDPFTVLLGVEGADTAIEVAVDIYDRVEPGEPVGPVPERDPLATFPVVPIAPGEGPDGQRTTGFTIQLDDGTGTPDPSWGYRLDEPGVYPVRVRLRGADGDTGVVLMTAIIRLPADDQPAPTTEVALLVPVHRAPPEDPEVRAGAAGLDASLAEELSPVLDALASHPDLPVTFAITPDTMARLAADPDRTDLVAQLRRELAGDRRQLLDASYVHLDPASLVAAGLDDELMTQAELGRRTLTQLLEPPASPTWQLTERMDEATVAALADAGLSSLVVPSSALVGSAGTTQPVELDAAGRTMRAVATSAGSAIDRVAGDDAVLAGHRILARLAAVGEADPPARVVVELDLAELQPAALAIVLEALAAERPPFAGATVDELLATPTDLEPATLVPAPPVDLGAYPATLSRSRDRLASYEAMVGGRRELVEQYELPLAVSAALDLPLEERSADAASVAEALEVPFTSITVPPADQVTLGARDARFPLPITSDLDEPVQVVIELQSNDRLEFPRNRLETTLVPGRQVIDIAVRTRAPGATPVRITVRTPDDAIVLAESRYTIRSTAVSGVGVLLTVGAAIVLAVWWARHWHRSRDEHRPARRRGRSSTDV